MKHSHPPIPADTLNDICRRYRVSELSMFGSAVRGVLDENSDIDVLVTFRPDAQIGFMEYSHIQRELSEAFGRKVDLVSKPGLKPVIREEILASSQVIYAE
ncbi:MAG: nucleotidyltransferase family protein [Nitrospinae bacterium]|nr:nucleotidyltransferase family protein [Nitrospinota bacterium]